MGSAGLQAVANASNEDLACRRCGEPFQPYRPKQAFCSEACRNKAWLAEHPRQPRLDFESYIAPRPLPEEPEVRRDEGKAIAASNNRWQLAQAQWLALEYLATHPVAIISDIRAFAAAKGIELEWEKNWVANVFMPGRKDAPWFEPTGVRRMSTHKRGHARKVNEYRLTAEGRAAYRAAKELMG